jgi:hypothetical protein
MLRGIREHRVVVLPVLYEPCEIPLFLEGRKYADFTLDYDNALRDLTESICNYKQIP